jgi:selenocysteine lyase/cysteine desulfurase
VLQTRLREEFHIEIPVIHWKGIVGVRASYQAYNTPEDMETLLDALSVLLPQLATG